MENDEKGEGMNLRRLLTVLLLGFPLFTTAQAQQPQGPGLAPTHADLAYGPHARNRLDLWLAKSATPTPLLICIHGGGFMAGDKRGYRRNVQLVQSMLDAGISVAAINYRLTEGGRNPFPAPMLDGARALQFLRYHARDYNLDKTRFAATGGSAGGMMLLWLGFHPDLAQADSEDPVLRESSRLQVLAPVNGPTSVDLRTLEAWFGVQSLTPHPAFRPLFGLPKDGPVPSTEQLLKDMHDASVINFVTADDPPVYLKYGPDRPVTETSPPGLWVHHPTMGKQLKKVMDALGLECQLEIRGGPKVEGYQSQEDFIIRKLKQP
jgi:hypothetical protein